MSGAGLVAAGGETTITVFEGCSVSVTIQVAVDPAATPETAAEISTAVFCAALAGTATTLGEIVTAVTAAACATPKPTIDAITGRTAQARTSALYSASSRLPAAPGR